MSNSVLLSVVLTVYNVEKYIFECLKSIEQQSFKDFELIIVDDGSTDNSQSIYLDFCKKNSNWHVIYQENKGPGVARNRGFSIARGEFIIFLDSDDIFHHFFFQKMVTKAIESSCDIVCCRAIGFNDITKRSFSIPYMRNVSPGITYTNKFEGKLLLSFFGWAWDKLFRRNFLKINNIIFPDLKNSEDLVFTYSALAFSKKIYCLNEELVYHRINRANSVSSQHIQNIFDFYMAICLLKKCLISKKRIWSREKWGFNNWALHFTLWYAFSLKDNESTLMIINYIKQGKLQEIDLKNYDKKYFTFYPFDLSILKSSPKFIFIQWKIFSFLNYIQKYGLKNTLSKIFSIFNL